ncbi:hypothetical protein GXW78_20175 [Roseomonas terrae]|uniref:Uncharacterized protein n=1 Tax=Neoroseomonas terrae TaxID=424799 RepID=A0ABS5ELT9_9PROT|nr:hypothetical protein [Neoroseomonas terrae]MBR0651993.1 hypothetical protein [Neoroseomonas terrae]
MKFPAPSREFHIPDVPAEGSPLWLARIAFADDSALADRVTMLGIRQRWAGESDCAPLSPEEQAEHDAGEQAIRALILRRLRCGELVARGIPEGRIQYEVIPPEAWRDVTVDWWESAIAVHGVEVRGIIVSPVPGAVKDAPAKPKSAAGRGRGRSYKDHDAPLVEEAVEAVICGAASGPMVAARGVADRATGRGEPESKVKRLTPRIQSRLNELGWQPR